MSFGQYLIGCLGSLAGLVAVFVIAVMLASKLIPGWRGPVAWTVTGLLAAGVAIIPALLLGTFGFLNGLSYLVLIVLLALAAWRWQDKVPGAGARPDLVSVPASPALTAVGAAVAAGSFGAFVAGTTVRFGTGMTGFDSTWYHGPFAAGIAQSGDTFSLHHLAPQFLSWFYPQNSEVIHALGNMAFGTDLLSIVINLGWFCGCLLAAWCIGRPYGAAPISLAGVALIIGSTAMADQAGEARNDIVGTFFLLAALAVMVNAAAGGRRITLGPALVVTLAAGLAAGTKVNFIPAAVVLLAGTVILAEPSRRIRTAAAGAGMLLIGGGYWYLRNLIHSGNPLPWIENFGPLSLPGPAQEVGGRDAGSVWGYLTDFDVIGDWFLPGLADGFGAGWFLVIALALAGLVLCLDRKSGPARRTGAAVGIALVFAWLVAPTSASGPPGEPNGFVSGLRYLAPALAVCFALLGGGVGHRSGQFRWLVTGAIVLLFPFTVAVGESWGFRHWLIALAAAGGFWLACLTGLGLWRIRRGRPDRAAGSHRLSLGLAVVGVGLLILCGQVVQRHYFENRYQDPGFTTPELAAAFKWSNSVEDAAIGTVATRQYPLWGPGLDNRVQFIGLRKPNGGFVKAENCVEFVNAVNQDEYEYLVLTLDRAGGKLDQARELTWIENDPAVRPVPGIDGSAVLALTGSLSEETCR